MRVLGEEPEDLSGARVRRVQGLTFWAETLYVRTQRGREFVDLTDRVAAVVARSGVVQGWVSVFSKHTTAAIVINENEPLLLEDLAGLLERLAGQGSDYGHNDLARRTGPMDAEECANGHSHCQHLLVGSSEQIPIAQGKVDLGRWQRVFLLELDRSRDRHVVVQVFGA
ncbi:MAG TPA: secondary thiamine-phosphate synthase enzyme YjbQ [Candidatus Limnocylindrales bacterium]|nr:secondary thiamine-phosphate synthase enzyme YjbQ [Candidatus Limnocylindrales bacterium]